MRKSRKKNDEEKWKERRYEASMHAGVESDSYSLEYTSDGEADDRFCGATPPIERPIKRERTWKGIPDMAENVPRSPAKPSARLSAN